MCRWFLAYELVPTYFILGLDLPYPNIKTLRCVGTMQGRDQGIRGTVSELLGLAKQSNLNPFADEIRVSRRQRGFTFCKGLGSEQEVSVGETVKACEGLVWLP